MTRKRSLTAGIFGMPQAIIDAALDQLTPAQRESIRPDQAADIMRAAVNTAELIGAIVERPVAQTAVDPRFLEDGSLAHQPIRAGGSR